MSEKLLEIRGLDVVYHSGGMVVHALNGIDLQLEKGETLGLVGETGAGKTTTALSVLRLLPERTGEIRAGSIQFNGESLLELNEAKMQAIRGSRVSMIFQDPMTALNPMTAIGEQIEESLRLHNLENRTEQQLAERVDEILTMVGIDPSRKKDYPHQFSGGMKQRVVIAMALACSPELLIADEPTTALDVTIQAQVLFMMQELKRKMDMGIILITHDLGVVAKVCDRVAVMYSGEIVESGTFEDFFLSDKHHPYTEGLFGSIPNIYSDEKRLRPIEGMPPDPTDLPRGCKFHPRCPYCVESCKNKMPGTFQKGSHLVQCSRFMKEEGYRIKEDSCHE